MRLIDADALIAQISEKHKKEEESYDLCVDELKEIFCSIVALVEKQPTAYDPDKVVQQLEEKTELAFQRYMNCTKNSPCYQRYQEQYLQRKMCLEIVKAGGADAKTDS
jgi:hypothetical protein